MRIIYDRVTVLQVVHNRGHGFSIRFTLQGCTTLPIHVRLTPRKKQIKWKWGITTQPNVILQQCSGGHTSKLPVTESAVSEDGPRVARSAIKTQRPESVTGRGQIA